MVARFEVGKTYRTRSIGDYDCIITATIERRTAHFVWVDGKRFGLDEYDGAEFFRPWGRYSMAPIMRADRSA